MSLKIRNYVFFLFGICVFTETNAQDESKLNKWFKKHQFTVSAGYMRADFKKQDLLVVSPVYNHSIRFFDVEAEDITYFENIKTLQFTATQHRVSFSANFKYNFQLSLNISHINYGAITSNTYRAQGKWEGKHINDRVLMSDYVKGLYHTNGLNLWNISAQKMIPIYKKRENINVIFNLGVHLGATVTSSEIEIKDTVGSNYLYYTPGNNLAGYHLGTNSSMNVVLYKHYVVQAFWDWSFANVLKAKFDDGYVKQKIYTNYFGVTLGYRF